MKAEIFFLLCATLITFSSGARSDDVPQGLSESAAAQTERPTESRSELALRLANESNQNDGALGPITYGLRGSHSFQSGVVLEGDFIRLHEPGSSFSSSFLDEAQLTLRFPETRALAQPIVVDVTAWKNRTIDMYTNLAGFDATRTGELSISAGIYAGTATRDELSGGFLGGQLGLGFSVGPIEAGASQMMGRISAATGTDYGFYRRTSLGISSDLSSVPKLPLTATLDLEDRYFKFGNGLATSAASDAFILVAGLELHLISR